MIVELDKLGRIVLKKELRDRFGKQFIIFPRKEEIVLNTYLPEAKLLEHIRAML